ASGDTIGGVFIPRRSLWSCISLALFLSMCLLLPFVLALPATLCPSCRMIAFECRGYTAMARSVFVIVCSVQHPPQFRLFGNELTGEVSNAGVTSMAGFRYPTRA